MNTETYVDTIVIGGGQAGLSVSYHLRELGVEHLVLDASPRIGDAWRNRWDSLHLFTPARYDGLDGMRFPGDPGRLAVQGRDGRLPRAVRAHVRPARCAAGCGSTSSRADGTATATSSSLVAVTRPSLPAAVVVAMSNYQVPRIPAFAAELSPDIRQLHAGDYRESRPAAARVAYSSSAPATRLPRSRRSSQPRIRSLWRGRAPVRSPVRSRASISRHVVVHILNGFVFPRVMSVNTPIGTEGPAEGHEQRGAADQGEVEGSGAPRRRAGRPRDRRRGRQARARRRRPSSTSRTSCGARVSRPASAGSGCPSSTSAASRVTSAAWPPRCPICISSDCTSSRRCRRRWCTGSAGTPPASPALVSAGAGSRGAADANGPLRESEGVRPRAG